MNLQSILKIGFAVALTLGLLYCTELVVGPLHLSSSDLKAMTPSQLMVFFEAAVLFMLLAAFVFQEVIEFYHRLFRGKEQTAPWGYLLYVLVAGFGSGTAYAMFLKVLELLQTPPAQG